MSKCLYTVIIGKAIDDLKPLKVTTRGWNYVCLTDQDLDPVEGWEIVKVPLLACGPIKTARFYKINYQEVLDFDLSIFIDATFAVNISLDRWERSYYQSPFTVIKHPADDCLFKEAESCIRIGRGDPMEIMCQAADYLREGMPKNHGLISSGILTRARDPKVKDFCWRWWQEVEARSSRDQIAFSYVRWKTGYCPYVTIWDYRTQREFFHIPHLYKNKEWREQKVFELELAKPVL